VIAEQAQPGLFDHWQVLGPVMCDIDRDLGNLPGAGAGSGAAPLKPLPEPVDPDLYRIRRQPRAGGLINEYRLVA
jgi:hypothetical protein